MTATLNATSKNILRTIGCKDVNDFIISQSKRVLTEKIQEQQSVIAHFEHKYGMTYAEFIVRVLDRNDPVLSKFGIIEKEDDDFDWENAIRLNEIFDKRFKNIA